MFCQAHLACIDVTFTPPAGVSHRDKESNVGYASHKPTDQKVLDVLQEALDALRADGTVERIRKSYLECPHRSMEKNAQTTSITRQLLIRAVAAYLLFGAVFVALDFTLQYRRIKSEATRELSLIHDSFGPGLAQALWDVNTDQINSFFNGLSNLPSVIGTSIRDE